MTIKIEQRLRFDFGRSWQVEKYDDDAIYRGGIEHLKEQIPCKRCLTEREVGTKAVDFVGRREGPVEEIYLIEVKDFRGHAIKNRKRIRDDLAIEVALKVRDTLAGLVGALHLRHASSWHPLAGTIFRRPPHVLLWLEEDLPPERIQQRADPTLVMRTALSGRLDWLRPHVMVLNQEKLWPELDLDVRRLPVRVYEVRRRMALQENHGSISDDDFQEAWSATPQTAGKVLRKLCVDGFLAVTKNGRYSTGPQWERFYEEPAGTSP